ncbi:MAG: hypothetical protein ABFC94_11265 [Syntrophomonas sp.]
MAEAFMVMWIILMISGIAAGLLLLIAIWKLMRAHELLAQSMKNIAETLHAQTREAASTTENKEIT